MATMANPPPGAFPVGTEPQESDPFVSVPAPDGPRHRYSAFDAHLFSLYSNGSPTQTRRALQAHLAETERRLQETSYLGTELVQQRKALTEKLAEIERRQGDNDIGPELRQKLVELEREFNEVGRETARVFLPKPRVAGSETADSGSSVSVFSSEAQHSPSKVHAPSRRQRNQQPSRINDIKLATEISSSLLQQIRDLQAVLAEKDEALRTAALAQSQMEIDTEGLVQRVRALDESENRYKDENWSLESQLQDLTAISRQSADREQRLSQMLNVAKSEKATIEREVEELKQAYGKLSEEHATIRKQHETEAASLRRNASASEIEREALHRKVDELTLQNQELAKAMAYRARVEEQALTRDSPSESEDLNTDRITPEHSPPPSPSKTTPRHGHLESETLKSSLHHAHRMIQNLKNNIHREKTEKIELKRMLQDARDELEMRRRDGGAGGANSASKKRKSNAQQDVFKKPLRPDRLGALRNSTDEILIDDDWEDHDGAATPSRHGTLRARASNTSGRSQWVVPSLTKDAASETAPENSDAFDTAHEREDTATETEAFQTTAETLDGDSSDNLTETENGVARESDRARRPTALATYSYRSTASNSDDEVDERDVRTPVQAQQPRYRLRISRGGHRRSMRSSSDLIAGVPQNARDSPAPSFVSDTSQPAGGQTLAAELSSFSDRGSETASLADSTPSRSALASADTSPESFRPRSAAVQSAVESHDLPRPPMVDNGTMTEPWEPNDITHISRSPLQTTEAAQAGGAGFGVVPDIQTGRSPSRQTSPDLGRYTEVVAPERRVEKLSGTEELQTADLTTVTKTEAVPNNEPYYLLDRPTTSHRAVTPDAQAVLGNEAVPAMVGAFPLETEQQQPTWPVKESSMSPVLHLSTISSQQTEPHDHAEPLQAVMFAEHDAPYSEELEAKDAEIKDMAQVIERLQNDIRAQEQARADTVTKQKSDTVRMTNVIESLQKELITTQTRTADLIRQKDAEIARLNEEMESRQAREQPVPESPVLPAADRQSMFLDTTNITRQLNLSRPSEPASQAVRGPLNGLAPDEAPLTFSAIHIQHTESEEPPRPSTAQRIPVITEMRVAPPVASHTEKFPVMPGSEAAKPGLGFFSSVRGWERSTPETQPPRQIVEDEPSKPAKGSDETAGGIVYPWSTPPKTTPERRVPFKPISANAVQPERQYSKESMLPKPLRLRTADEGTQTMMSSKEIDQLVRVKDQGVFANVPSLPSPTRTSFGRTSPNRPRDLASAVEDVPYKAPRKLGGSGSIRNRAMTPPPLPADHKQVIAAAASKAPPPGSMGPPTMPASAYRNSTRSRTPTAVPAVSPSKGGGTTPRPKYGSGRSEVVSPITRRSSVSSFASEMDQRFNIAGNPLASDAFDPGTTDPRMIQAITQTMIGEYLWKYTRKAGREDMSGNRHRRFFWVHPYTRTLYWSEQDPATAGRAQLKAKSVAIEKVRVVTDDNPFPPGLHRKSLVVKTPGRSIKFTAPTAQRHETWFNALSYLLLRTSQEREDDTNALTSEDVDEFNPGYFSRWTHRTKSRASLSSYNSRTTRTSSPQRPNVPSLAARQSAAAERAHASPTQPSNLEKHGSLSGRLSSLSGMFRPSSSVRGSFSSRRSRPSEHGTEIYDASVLQDSAEELRQVIEQQEREADRLENVRACCDGESSEHRPV